MVSGLAEPRRTSLRVGQIVEIDVTDLLANGQGVGRALGVVVFLWGPLPGERARARVTVVKARYAVAEMLERLTSSPHRAEPFCPVFGSCGGCQVQHLAYGAQLDWKRTMVESALRRIGNLDDPDVAAPVGMADPRRYRNKMGLVVSRGSRATEFGFYSAGTHDVVPVHACPVVHPQLDATIESLWEAANDTETAGAFAGARHVVARVGTSHDETVVAVTTERESSELLRAADALRGMLPGAAGITNSYDLGSPNAVLGRKNVTVAGEPEIEQEIGGVSFRVSAASFFQINGEMVAQIFAVLAPQVRAGMRIVDLYCGAGTFALYFAKLGARVTGVEESAAAVREAKANAQRNSLNAAFFAGRVERSVGGGQVAAALRSADVVFLDPPRKGSDEDTLGAIASANVPRIWYLSCNPATLARDLAFLVGFGYVVDGAQPFDMFPHTGHIEVLAYLHRPERPSTG